MLDSPVMTRAAGVFAAAAHGRVVRWDLGRPEAPTDTLMRISNQQHRFPPVKIAVSRDARLAAEDDSGEIMVWDLDRPSLASPSALDRGAATILLKGSQKDFGKKNYSQILSFAQDGRLVVAERSGTLRIWNTTGGPGARPGLRWGTATASWPT